LAFSSLHFDEKLKFWSAVEVYTATIAFCLPSLKGLVQNTLFQQRNQKLAKAAIESTNNLLETSYVSVPLDSSSSVNLVPADEAEDVAEDVLSKESCV
jgi:hypothetical protein